MIPFDATTGHDDGGGSSMRVMGVVTVMTEMRRRARRPRAGLTPMRSRVPAGRLRAGGLAPARYSRSAV